jgi:hypothetical protein
MILFPTRAAKGKEFEEGVQEFRSGEGRQGNGVME